MDRRSMDGSGAREFPERWTAKQLTEAMPGSTRKWWLTTMIPELVGNGVLRKVGRHWIGRRSAITTALLGNAA